jgi:Ni/Fe-hydrogenase subunit HybB-like protein
MAGFATFIWRIMLTTGTGSIFAFLVARQAYGTALLAPMFIIMSFCWGLAVFLVVQSTMYAWNGMTLPPLILQRMKNLLATFVAAVLYFTIVLHLTNASISRRTSPSNTSSCSTANSPACSGSARSWSAPCCRWRCCSTPATAAKAFWVNVAALLVIVGAFFQLYVFIIGGQAFPLDMFPGYDVKSSFMDGMPSITTARPCRKSCWRFGGSASPSP